MPEVRNIAGLFLVILAIVFVSFFYFGITTKQSVSEDYGIPIAKTIISGEFMHIHSTNPFIYFPGSSYAIVAIFLFLGLPINLFGLLSWVCLFFVCKKLGDTFGLNTYMAFIFAASVCTLTTVIRTIGDQSIDKWLCAWFVLSVLLLEKPQRSLKYSLLLGFSLGMLIGTKYSGPLFFLALVPVYGIKLLRSVSPLRFLATSITFTVFGLFWYIRNFILTGNPYYPDNFLFFKGIHQWTMQDNMLWKTPFAYPQGIVPLLNAFLSEYMIWAFSGFIILWFIVYSYRKKESIDMRILRSIVLVITTGIAALLMPITPPYYVAYFHIVSDMRYITIFVVMLIFAVFLIANKYKQHTLLASVTFLNAIPLFSFIPYQPKFFILCIVLGMVVYAKPLPSLHSLLAKAAAKH